MNRLDSPMQDSLKKRWQVRRAVKGMGISSSNTRFINCGNPSTRLQVFPGLDDNDLLSSVVPPVTVVLEGRSIGHRISLHKHASYQSLAKALRQMFVDGTGDAAPNSSSSEHDGGHHLDLDLDLSNAVPGHLIAYEDMENDLLLAGDLNWKDFVRVAKRIRILPVPAKGNSRKAPTRN